MYPYEVYPQSCFNQHCSASIFFILEIIEKSHHFRTYCISLYSYIMSYNISLYTFQCSSFCSKRKLCKTQRVTHLHSICYLLLNLCITLVDIILFTYLSLVEYVYHIHIGWYLGHFLSLYILHISPYFIFLIVSTKNIILYMIWRRYLCRYIFLLFLSCTDCLYILSF